MADEARARFSDKATGQLRRLERLIQDVLLFARGESIAYWKQHLHRVTEAELEMLYTHLSNGLMHVVVEGYEKYSREEVVRFVNRIVQCSLSQFQ